MIAKKIRQARLAAGISLDDTVLKLKKAGFTISKPALSHYENGKRTPNAEVLQKLGKVFSVPSSWFMGAANDFSITWFSYRAQSTLGVRRRNEIEAYASHLAEKQTHVYSLFPQVSRSNFPDRKKVTSIDEADSVAADIREKWALGTDALESVTQTLETHGAMVLHYNAMQTAKFDGVSAMVNNTWPLLLINSKVSPDRLRFDLAHELGHVLMDTRDMGDPKAEEFAANRFASSFLMPPPVLKFELGKKRANISLSELLLLKEKYGISAAALLYAANVHGIITKDRYTILQKQISARGWRKEEPAVFSGNEQPFKLRQLVLRALAEELLSVKDACILFPNFAGEIQREFHHEQSTAQVLRNASKTERNAKLQAAAEKASEDYKKDADMIVDGGLEFYDYE